jgi:hypothetical protein
MRILLLVLGFFSSLLIVFQLVLGLLILSGSASMVTAHKHSGFLTVAVTLTYIILSMLKIASIPTRDEM